MYMMTQKGDLCTKVFSSLSEVILVLHLGTVKYSLQQCDKTIRH